MPLTDRSTLRLVMDEVLSLLRANLVADPPTGARPFRRVEAGAVAAESGPRPLLGVTLVKARAAAALDDDKVWEATTQLAVVVDLTAADAHGGMLDAVAAVEDGLDALREVGVVAGADGLDDRAWSFEVPAPRAGPRTGVAKATQTFVARVGRGANRAPA